MVQGAAVLLTEAAYVGWHICATATSLIGITALSAPTSMQGEAVQARLCFTLPSKMLA